MIDRDFSINNRFWVDVTLNVIKDLETLQEQRLEPRLMQVLCILAKHEGKLVKREDLIAEVWNNYGGGEDGLNQAISILRKTLQDTEKDIIETIPKKGYILHARLSSHVYTDTENSRKKKFSLKYPAMVAVVLLAIWGIVYVGLNRKVRVGQKPEPSGIKASKQHQNNSDSLEVKFSELNNSEKENPSNTISTTSPDGTRYKMVAIGDKRPELYVNDKLISGSELEKYAEIQDQLLRKLWDRNKREDSISRKRRSGL